MVVHNGYDILEHKQLAWACRIWSHYLLDAIREQGSDDSFVSPQNVNDFMETLIVFASQSFDFWVDSIFLERSIIQTLWTLNSVASELETLYQYSPHMLTTIESIKAFTGVRRPDNSKSNFAARLVADISSTKNFAMIMD